MREIADGAIALEDVSQLLWAGQGITDPTGLRTAPSAGALYPLEVLLVAGNVDELPAGLYRYRPESHELIGVETGDRRRDLAVAALGQDWMEDAACVIAIVAVPERTARKYGERAARYVHLEAGHAAQNVLLQAAALGLATTPVGAFDDEALRRVLSLRVEEVPLLLIPVGRPSP